MNGWQDRICQFCWHDNELHDYTPDKRVPKEVQPGKYMCLDCASCDVERVGVGNAA
jgi:superfamily II helicase